MSISGNCSVMFICYIVIIRISKKQVTSSFANEATVMTAKILGSQVTSYDIHDHEPASCEGRDFTGD